MLEEFGQPLVVQEVDLAEPKAGEALVRLAACGVCHTDLYTASGADPTGYAPCVLGHEGAGVVEAVGDGVTLVKPGDHVITLFAPECGECVHCLQPADEPLHRDPRPAERRLPARRHDAPLPRRRAAAPLHGHLDLRRVHGDARDRAREGRPGGARRRLRAVRLRPLDRDRRRALHGERQPGATVAVFGCGLVGLGAVIGARLAGAERIVAFDLSEERLAEARHHGATDTRLAGDDAVEWIRAETGGFGADYTFEATGNVKVMQQAVEAAREAWGLATMCGVAGKGELLEVLPRLLITGRRVTGSSFGGVKGRTQVPQLVDRWLAGEIDVEALSSPPADPRRGQPRLRADGAQDGIRSVIEFD